MLFFLRLLVAVVVISWDLCKAMPPIEGGNEDPNIGGLSRSERSLLNMVAWWTVQSMVPYASLAVLLGDISKHPEFRQFISSQIGIKNLDQKEFLTKANLLAAQLLSKKKGGDLAKSIVERALEQPVKFGPWTVPRKVFEASVRNCKCALGVAGIAGVGSGVFYLTQDEQGKALLDKTQQSFNRFSRDIFERLSEIRGDKLDCSLPFDDSSNRRLEMIGRKIDERFSGKRRFSAVSVIKASIMGSVILGLDSLVASLSARELLKLKRDRNMKSLSIALVIHDILSNRLFNIMKTLLMGQRRTSGKGVIINALGTGFTTASIQAVFLNPAIHRPILAEIDKFSNAIRRHCSPVCRFFMVGTRRNCARVTNACRSMGNFCRKTFNQIKNV